MVWLVWLKNWGDYMVRCWKCAYPLVGGTCDNGCPTYPEHMRDLDAKNIAALFEACGEYHAKRSRPGGAAICICGHGCGGSSACSGLSILRDLFRYADFKDPNWRERFEFVQRCLDR